MACVQHKLSLIDIGGTFSFFKDQISQMYTQYVERSMFSKQKRYTFITVYIAR